MYLLDCLSKTKLFENKYLILGHLFFFTLFVFSIIFAFERVIYVDSCAQIFEFIRDEGFEIYAQRYSMYLFQFLPVLAVKLHLPLSAVIFAYSLSTPLIGYVLWLITVYLLKDKQIGILMLFVMLGIRHTFYHAISETFQLMFLSAFLYAWLFQTRNYQRDIISRLFYYSIALIFIVLCIFIHPVAVFFVLFILGIYLLNKQFSISQKVIIAVLSIGVIFLKLSIIKQGSHDASFMVSTHEFISRISDFFVLNSTRWFHNSIRDFYWIPLLMFILSLYCYWKKGKYFHVAFFVSFVALFWIVTVVTYAPGGIHFAMERSFLPLFFFCGIPFITEMFPSISFKWNNVFFAGFVILLSNSFTKIALASTPYSLRLQKIEQISTLANRQGKKKIIMNRETANQLFPVDSWGIGLESMVYSALKGVDSTVNIYVVENIDEIYEEKFLNPENHFAVPWWTFWKIDALNPHYFKLPKILPVILTLGDDGFVINEVNISKSSAYIP